MTHYEVLGVSNKAPAEVITAAWKALARVYHPDREGGSASKMQRVNAAYEVLKDPAKRAQYDLSLEAAKPPKKTAKRHNDPANLNQSRNGFQFEYQSTGNDGLDYLMMQFSGMAVQAGAELLNHFAQQNPIIAATLEAARKAKK